MVVVLIKMPRVDPTIWFETYVPKEALETVKRLCEEAGWKYVVLTKGD